MEIVGSLLHLSESFRQVNVEQVLHRYFFVGGRRTYSTHDEQSLCEMFYENVYVVMDEVKQCRMRRH